MILEFKNNNSAIDGLSFVVSPDKYTLSYGTIKRNYTRNDENENVMPCVIYDFFLSFGNTLKFTDTNKSKDTQYITKGVGDCIVSFSTDSAGNSGKYKIIIK